MSVRLHSLRVAYSPVKMPKAKNQKYSQRTLTGFLLKERKSSSSAFTPIGDAEDTEDGK